MSAPASSEGPRKSSTAPFWDERFAEIPRLFGDRPNAFVERQAEHLPAGGHILDLGGGDGRHARYLASLGFRCTLVDFSAQALRQAEAHARASGILLRTVRADVLCYEPSAPFEGIVATFLQLLPDERPQLWRSIRRWLAPGGVFVGVFFRPEQITGAYPSGGPPTLDRMVTADELRAAFGEEGLEVLQAPTVTLADGPVLNGAAAVLHVRYRAAATAA